MGDPLGVTCVITEIHFDAWGDPTSGEAQLVLSASPPDPQRLRLPVTQAAQGSLKRLKRAIKASWSKQPVVITYAPGPDPNASLFDVIDIAKT